MIRKITIKKYSFRPVMIMFVVILGMSFIQSPVTLAQTQLTGTNGLYSIYLSVLYNKTAIHEPGTLENTAALNCEVPVRIMPLGDSITAGSKSSNTNGYRKPLYLALGSAGFWVDFVGAKHSGGNSFDRDHEGHSGMHAEDQPNKNRDIYSIAYQQLSKNPADIVLLHIGTNDISVGGQDAQEVSRILDEIDRYDPDIIVVLAKIINRKTYSPATTQYNQDLQVMANQRINDGDKIVVVDMENALTYPGDLQDEVHPNNQGYAKMAVVWYDALQKILPVCGTPATSTPTSSPTITPTGTSTPDPTNPPEETQVPTATAFPTVTPPANTRWETASPASVGMDESILLQARNYALTGGGSGYIIRNGKLVLAWGDPLTKYPVYSTAKSIGLLSLGLALADNRLGLEDPAQLYHPSLGVPPDGNAATGWLDDITIRRLANHSAGFDKPGGYADLIYEPGSTWAYSDGGANWLAETLTLVFGEDLKELLFRRVFTPIGIVNTDLSWRKNLYRSLTLNGVTNREFASGISANMEALSRIGYLYLREGQWNGQQIIPKEFIELARTVDPDTAGLPVHNPSVYFNASDHYGLYFWNNADGTLPDVPRDAYWAWGLEDSLVVVIPSLDIVAVRAGSGWRGGWTADYSVLDPFLTPIAQSVVVP